MLAVGVGALTVLMRPPGTAAPRVPSPSAISQPAGPADGRVLAAALQDLVTSGSGNLSMVELEVWLPEDARGLAYAALRSDGERMAEAWHEADRPDAALRGAVLDAAGSLSAAQRGEVDTVEVAIAGRDAGEENVDGSVADNLDRGILGMRVELADRGPLLVSPTPMIADNTTFVRVIERAREDGLEPMRVVLFEATQFLVDLDGRRVIPMVRGAEPVPAASVTVDAAASLGDGMGDWLFGQLGEDGRLVYEYWPSRGEESDANNMIRQWMATVAMTRVANQGTDQALLRRVAQNIDYNVAISYSEEDGLGLIADPDGDVKLGAVALAALAISQHPERERWRSQEDALRRTVDRLWQPDGSFRTFYRPADRTDNQNFYPGEALLLWATILEENPGDRQLRERFMASFRHYREWHRDQPNPAFVPWHTMAYEKVWRLTEDAELRDFMFEMNDWLLSVQQWESAPAPDVAGRFYDPDRPDYGPPHASSDGVYLEGLIAAYRVAERLDDRDRVERYRVAIGRGLRNLLQLQFADEVDMYYVSQRDRVAGGIRTNVYDNRIRLDNVQHGLMAVLDIIEAFDPAEYRISGP